MAGRHTNNSTPPANDDQLKANRRTKVLLFGIVFFMVCMSFASVPLYRIFCQKTGYGGTPREVDFFATRITDRELLIEFNADVHRNLNWEFKPSQHKIKVRAGEPALAFYTVKNISDEPIIGIASYNVTPDKAGPYFNKVKCFCFDQQLIEPGQEVEMPVQFYIDPDIESDDRLKNVRIITLSYTFFEAKDFNNLNTDWGY